MLEPVLAGIPAAFWRRAASARHRLLMVDYDGTLAPFRSDPLRAVPLTPSVTLLGEIATRRHTTVAVLSGRPAGELQAFLGALPATLVGENGWEELIPGAALRQHALDPRHEAALDRAAAAAATRGWGPLIERKRASLMLHVRRLQPSEAPDVELACEALWGREASLAGLRLVRVDGGLELRAPGRDKGTAAAALLSGSPSGTFPVHVGDDVTDEDAFGEIERGGFGIRVGGPTRASRARGWLGSWLDVPVFLRRWLAIVERAGAPRSVTT